MEMENEFPDSEKDDIVKMEELNKSDDKKIHNQLQNEKPNKEEKKDHRIFIEQDKREIQESGSLNFEKNSKKK